MPATQIRWSSLFNLIDVEFIPEQPRKLEITDELLQTIAWLTGATRHDRRLLRCNEQGGLLVGNSWDLLESVETAELYPQSGTTDAYTATVLHQGVLVSTSGQLVKASFVRYSGGSAEVIYIAPSQMFFYPYKVYSITLATVPDPTGTASYVGITAFN